MSDVRVRFAPSPTGHLHMGGARTALFNWLFARHEGGRFIVRVEDTDRERSDPALETQLLEDLAWLGLDWDEGPGRNGSRGPYRQSNRMEIYRTHVDRLLAADMAYPCFCTEEELDRKREEMTARGEPPRYDGSCSRLTAAERERLRGEGRPASVRFRFPAEEERRIEDIIRGEVVFPPGMVGDFVVMRSNGMPTYNFAAAVDDAMMEITHVVRGEEHLSNTLRQIVIYESLGLDAPRFAHLPLILGADRSKLSKRHGAPNVADFRERGFPRDGIVNYLAFLGWSPGDGREILSVEELVRVFTLERVSPSPSIFDEVKMEWVCARHVRDGGAARFLDDALPWFPPGFAGTYDRAALGRIFDIAAEQLPAFSRLAAAVAPFRPGSPELDEEARVALAGAAPILRAVRDALAGLDAWERDAIAAAVKSAGAAAGAKGRHLFMPLRAALTGAVHGPDLAAVIAVRGREDVLCALDAAATDGGGKGRPS